MKARAPGPILCCPWVQSCCWHWAGGPALGGRCIKGRERPVCGSKSCCWRCSSSTPVSQLPHLKEGSFSSACPGKALIIQPWEGKLGAACLEACPALITCPGIRARPVPEAVCQPSCLAGLSLVPVPCPLSPVPHSGSTTMPGCGIRPLALLHPFRCPALVIDAQLWLESLSLGKKMNRRVKRIL